MRAPSHFFPDPSPSLFDALATVALSPLGLAYGLVASRRLKSEGAKAPVPVICVGNPVAGGAGKTPTALALARMLREAGARPVFLSRGYGGAITRPHHVDPAHDSAFDVGDEALLLARSGPSVIAADRVAGAALAAEYGDVIVMDDGFQNPSLQKDLSLLVIDRLQGLGNGLPLPAGPMRAFLSPQMARADAVILIGESGTPNRASPAVREAARRAKPVFSARFTAPLPERCLSRPLIAFTGIGRPQKFLETVTSGGGTVVGFRPFGDHHVYMAGDAERLMAEAERENALLVTTEKDAVKLAGHPKLDELAARVIVVPGQLSFEDEAGLMSRLIAPLARKARASHS
ncbi:MAG: tetraacyldisaccharide 4'-kinase [Hyphomicrobiaceae bacterium]|nr:tetraacyldisaccharide 4'-kinase [Hyphomicrobiaceae bacterium]